MHVADVVGIHSEKAGDEGEGKEDDCYDCEGVDGVVVAVFVAFDLEKILCMLVNLSD